MDPDRNQQMNGIPSIILAILLLAGVTDGRQQTATAGFLLRVTETKADLSPTGITGADCIVIQPDGKFHLERRLQQLPKPKAKLTVFESQLTKAQLAQLHTVLDQPPIGNIPELVLPVPPLGVGNFRTFIAEISLHPAVRRLGYFAWQGTPQPGAPPDSTPAQTKKDWLESQQALRPLETWLHDLENQKLHPSKAHPNFCGEKMENN